MGNTLVGRHQQAYIRIVFCVNSFNCDVQRKLLVQIILDITLSFLGGSNRVAKTFAFISLTPRVLSLDSLAFPMTPLCFVTLFRGRAPAFILLESKTSKVKKFTSPPKF